MAFFRHLYRKLVPRWLAAGDPPDASKGETNTDDGAIVLHSLGMLIDAALERMEQGLNARFPTRAVASANTLTGQDRGIFRGRNETEAHYAQRLVRWRYPRGHRVRGSAFALLEQVCEYWGAGVSAYTIDASGNRYDRSVDGTETYTPGEPWDWDTSDALGRFWLVIKGTPAAETPDFGDAALWGGELATPGYAVGMTVWTPDDTQAMRRLMQPPAWKPAGSRAMWIVVSLDGTEPTPNDAWEHWSENVAGVQVASRDSAFRYVSLTPSATSLYAGDPTLFAEESPLPDGTSYAGDPDSTAAWGAITLPDGSTYSGDPTSYPLSARLLDDGEQAQ